MLSDETLQMIREALKAERMRLVEVQKIWAETSNNYKRLQYDIDRIDAAHAELAAQERWEPLEDGTLAIVLTGLERYQRQIGRAELQGWYKTKVAQHEIERIESMLRELRGTDEQNPTLAICRRQGETMLSDQTMQVIREALAIVRRANEYESALVQNEDAWNAVVDDVEKRNAEIDAALAELDTLAAHNPTPQPDVLQK